LILKVVSGVEALSYEGKPAISAPVDLGLVKIDEDPWVTQWATATVARHYAFLPPSDRLLVDEFDGGERAWLHERSLVSPRYKSELPTQRGVIVPIK
jgi:hypothetical protein